MLVTRFVRPQTHDSIFPWVKYSSFSYSYYTSAVLLLMCVLIANKQTVPGPEHDLLTRVCKPRRARKPTMHDCIVLALKYIRHRVAHLQVLGFPISARRVLACGWSVLSSDVTHLSANGFITLGVDNLCTLLLRLIVRAAVLLSSE